MFANTRLLLVASILCCFWQHIDASGFFKKEFNFDEVDAVLRADGMRADGSASETKKHIENFVPPKDSNIKREIEFLKQLCIFEFRHCRKKLKDTMKSVGSIQENSKLSTALRVFAEDRRAKIIATCMQEIENNSETDLSRGMSHRLSKLKKLRGEDDLDYYDLLGVVKSGSYYDEIDDMLPRIDRVIAIINNNYKLVSRRMENLGINSYSMDELSGQEAKNAYALYLVRRKINKMDSDMREFVKSRSELHRTLLNNIVSNSNTSRNRRFYFNNIKALARREMSKPNIISKLGVAGSDKVQIREALEGLLSEACGSDRMSEFYQLVALDIWDDKLPMSRHAKNMAAMCYWSRCVPPGIRDRPQNLMTKLDDLVSGK